MNILMNFEDTYGCATLFKEFSHRDELKHNYRIEEGNGDSGAFIIPRNRIKTLDLAIIVFDLDSNTKFSLTSDELKRRLKVNILTEDERLKQEYINKIILIPTFFCYETLYLYSLQIKNLVKSVDVYKSKSESTQLLSLYKKYYDYSVLNPECLDGAFCKLNQLKLERNIITNTSSKYTLYPQGFHKSYSKQALKIMFEDVMNEYGELYGKRDKDKIFDKHEDMLFKLLKEKGHQDFLDSILKGIEVEAILNKDFYRLIYMVDIVELSDLILTEQRLTYLYNLLDDYNSKIKMSIKQQTKIGKQDLEANYLLNKLKEN